MNTLKTTKKKALVLKTPEVLFTTNYDQFKILPGNRPISDYHVRQLAKSYDLNPNLAVLRPILVNEHYEIVDGQHRLAACRLAEIPVPYIVAPGLSVSTAQTMNALQRAWTLRDFIRSYSYAGNVNYQAVEGYMDEYGLGPVATLFYIQNGEKSATRRGFKLGRFEMPADRTDVDDRFNKLMSFDDANLPWRTDAFAKAFLSVLRSEGYDHDRMLNNLKLAAPNIKLQPNRLSWLHELERIYNYGGGRNARLF